MKKFRYSFLRNYESCKVETHMDNGLMYCVYRNHGQGPIILVVTYLDRFYNIPLMKIFIKDFSGTIKSVKLKLGTHMASWLMYHVNSKRYIPL